MKEQQYYNQTYEASQEIAPAQVLHGRNQKKNQEAKTGNQNRLDNLPPGLVFHSLTGPEKSEYEA